MSEPKIIRPDSLGECKYESPLKGAISRFYENEGIAANATRVDLQALLEAQLAAVPRVIIGGFSMGAAVAAEAALQYLSRSPSSTSKRRLHLIMLN